MTHSLSRRRFLKQMTAAGGAALIGPLAARAEEGATTQKPTIGGKARAGTKAATPMTGAKTRGGSRPYRPGQAEVVQNEEHLQEYQALTRLPVFKMQIVPHWFGDNSRFWYRNALAHGQSEFIRVEATQGVRGEAFGHAKLAAGLSQASGQSYTAGQLPFDAVEFADDDKSVRFSWTAWGGSAT